MADDHDHEHGHKHPSRRALIGRAAALGLAVPLSRITWAATPKVTHEMARAANAWLSSLDDPQRNMAQLPWSLLREDWHYVPRRRPGIPIGRMNQAQARGGMGPARHPS